MKFEGSWARNCESADELRQAFESWMTTCNPRDRLCHGVRALLSWIGTSYERIALAFGCGMRRAETSRARWEDFNFEKRTVTVHRAKVGISHTIPMSPFVYDALLKFKRDSGPVAATGLSNATRDLQRLCAGIGIKYRSLHALRHGFASLLLARKVPTHVVARLGGWSDLKTLSRYSHPYDGAAEEAVTHLG